MNSNKELENTEDKLVVDIRSLINEAKKQVAVTVNSTTSLLYWSIGSRITTDILANKRAGYGKLVVQKLSTKLTLIYGKGWSSKQLHHCIRFAETFKNKEIIYALSR